jgi:hypothetical protein
MCAHVDNQRSHGVVIARLRTFVWSLLHQPSRSPPIDLPLPHGRSGTNLLSSGIKF